MTQLDLTFVRTQFPAFTDAALQDWSHFEHAGGSHPCQQVIDRLTSFYTSMKVQPGHPHGPGLAAQAAMDEGAASLAPWLGVTPDWIQVGPSTTANTVVLSHAFGQILSPGDAIIVTEQDHEANSGPWRRLADRGIDIREWLVDPTTGALATDDLRRLLDEDVKVVAFPAASNVLGQRNPVKSWCEVIRAAGAVSVVDAVALAPHGIPDVGALGADVLLFSTYKTYGPHQGVMVIDPALVERLPNQGHFFNAGIAHKRLVPAGPDHAQVASLAGIAEYLELTEIHHFGHLAAKDAMDVRRARVAGLWQAHETALLKVLLQGLAEQGLPVLGPTDADDRVPTVAVDTERPPGVLAAALADHRLITAGSHFYAWRLVKAMGIDPDHGVLRFSFVHTTSREDIDRLLAGLAAVA